ncbi:MAG: DNA adenine methylase [Candidatus Aminicenantes bacterium]|nr:MAG: DNA adenine methylase [Candidatus Aminicenantes bacterium]
MSQKENDVKQRRRPQKISPIKWPGGKRVLAKKIISIFPEHKLYAEAFAGALHVLFHKDPSHAEAINDINSDLINFYQVVKEKPYQLLSELQWDLPSRKLFLDYKAQLEGKTDLTDVERAKLFFYVLKMSFSGTMRQYGYKRTDKPPINLVDIERVIMDAHDRLKRVNIENIDWKRFLLKYDSEDTLFYLDPPHRCETSKVYVQFFTDDDYIEVKDTLIGVKGVFLLSLNDDDFIRETFKDFNIEEVETLYSMSTGSPKKAKELIFKNF